MKPIRQAEFSRTEAAILGPLVAVSLFFILWFFGDSNLFGKISVIGGLPSILFLNVYTATGALIHLLIQSLVWFFILSRGQQKDARNQRENPNLREAMRVIEIIGLLIIGLVYFVIGTIATGLLIMFMANLYAGGMSANIANMEMVGVQDRLTMMGILFQDPHFWIISTFSSVFLSIWVMLKQKFLKDFV